MCKYSESLKLNIFKGILVLGFGGFAFWVVEMSRCEGGAELVGWADGGAQPYGLLEWRWFAIIIKCAIFCAVVFLTNHIRFGIFEQIMNKSSGCNFICL